MSQLASSVSLVRFAAGTGLALNSNPSEWMLPLLY